MSNFFSRLIVFVIIAPFLLSYACPVTAQEESDPVTPLACALKLARELDPEKDSFEKEQALQQISLRYWRAGEHDAALDVYREMGCDSRQFLYSVLADEAMRSGLREYNLRLIEATVSCVDDPAFYRKNRVFIQIVHDLTTLHQHSKALEIAQLIEDDSAFKASAFAEVAEWLINAAENDRAVGLLDRAIGYAKAADEEDSDRACEAAIKIADLYGRAGVFEKSATAQAFAFKLASESRNDKSRLQTLLAVWFAQKGNWDESARLLDSINKQDRPRSLIGVAIAYTSVGHKAKAIELLHKASVLIASDDDSASSDYFKSELAKSYLSLGEPKLALNTIRGMTQDYGILVSTIALADWYIKHKNPALAEESLELASTRFKAIVAERPEEIEAIMSTSRAKEKADYLSQLADKFIQLGRFGKAKVAIEAIDLPQARAGKLADLAGGMITASQHDKALAVLTQAQELSDTAEVYPLDLHREPILANIAQRYGQADEREQSVFLFKRILESIRDPGKESRDLLIDVGLYYERSGLGHDQRVTDSLLKILKLESDD